MAVFNRRRLGVAAMAIRAAQRDRGVLVHVAVFYFAVANDATLALALDLGSRLPAPLRFLRWREHRVKVDETAHEKGDNQPQILGPNVGRFSHRYSSRFRLKHISRLRRFDGLIGAVL